LIKEKSSVAGAYKNKSVAEQNSIELAWNLLMEPCYKDLRECIFETQAEMTRFRGLVVTAVMATDIADKELAAMRKGRAAEAFSAEDEEAISTEIVSRKATFVLETLVQVADVSHTMGPFNVYKRWNHRLYKEMYAAYRSGRAGSDPTDTWYKGEFGFFDFYVMPLARKLKSCGVFDKVCDDWLNNAIANRKLWEAEGEAIVAGFADEEMNPKPKITFTNMASIHSSASVSDHSSVANSFHEEGDSLSLESDVDISISSGESILEAKKREERRIAFSGKISASGGRAPVSLTKKVTKAKTSGDDAFSKKNQVEGEKEEPEVVTRPSFVEPLAPRRVLTKSKSASVTGPRTAATAKPEVVTRPSFVEPLAPRRVLTKSKSASVTGPRTAATAKLFVQPEPSSEQPSEQPKVKIRKRVVRRTKSDALASLVPAKAVKKKKKAEKSADNKIEESDKAKERPSVRRHKSRDEVVLGTMSINSAPSLVKTRNAPTVKTDEERIKKSSSFDAGSDHQKSSTISSTSTSTSTKSGGEKPKKRGKRPIKSEKKEKAPAAPT
jgi:hypothetical protein